MYWRRYHVVFHYLRMYLTYEVTTMSGVLSCCASSNQLTNRLRSSGTCCIGTCCSGMQKAVRASPQLSVNLNAHLQQQNKALLETPRCLRFPNAYRPPLFTRSNEVTTPRWWYSLSLYAGLRLPYIANVLTNSFFSFFWRHHVFHFFLSFFFKP